jgi:ribosome-binding ATPase YchF (GTP1/OBG family)
MLLSLTSGDEKVFEKEILLWQECVKSFAKSIMSKLNMITFFTSVSDETHSWNILAGSSVQTAAGKIHTDFEKKFIKAEVCAIDSYFIINNMVRRFSGERKEKIMSFTTGTR